MAHLIDTKESARDASPFTSPRPRLTLYCANEDIRRFEMQKLSSERPSAIENPPPSTPNSVLIPPEDSPSDDEDPVVAPSRSLPDANDIFSSWRKEVWVRQHRLRRFFNLWQSSYFSEYYWPPVPPSRRRWSDASQSAMIFNLDLSENCLRGERTRAEPWKVSFVAEQLSHLHVYTSLTTSRDTARASAAPANRATPTFVGVTEIGSKRVHEKLIELLENLGHGTHSHKVYPYKFEYIAHSWDAARFETEAPSVSESRGVGPAANTRGTDPSGHDPSGRFIWTRLKSTDPSSSARLLLVTCHMPHRSEKEKVWERLCKLVAENSDVTVLLQGDTNENPLTLQSRLCDGYLALDQKDCPNTTTADINSKVIDNFVFFFPHAEGEEGNRDGERERECAAFEKNKHVRYRKTGYTSHHVMELVFNPKLLETRRETPTRENAPSS